MIDLAARAERCKQEAVYHMQLAKKEPASAGRVREQHRARLSMEERKRVHTEHDKALRMRHALQMQIDSIVATDVDNLIVDTMRAYNLNASRLSLPARTDQISRLGDELSDRQSELTALQEALTSVTQQMDTTSLNSMETSEEQLLGELEQLLADDVLDDKKEPAAPAVPEPLCLPGPPAADPEEEDGAPLLRRVGDAVPLAG